MRVLRQSVDEKRGWGGPEVMKSRYVSSMISATLYSFASAKNSSNNEGG